MRTKIDIIWEELEKTELSPYPVLMRGYPGKVLAEVYIGLKVHDSQRCLAVHLDNASLSQVRSLGELEDIKFEVFLDTKNKSKVYLLILLLEPTLKEIFSTLCEDLIASISGIKDERRLVRGLVSRLEKWVSLFIKAKSPGLSQEAQLGLYGELYFLRKWLLQSNEREKCLKAWVGVEKAVRDFQFGDWALEVKASHGNNHQKIHISSERQLDTSNLRNLYLFHLSLDVRQESGETLNSIVDSIVEILTEDYVLWSLFQIKLVEAGYIAQHREQYTKKGYYTRNEAFYEVKDAFPRIEEKDLREGVGDVKYTIISSDCSFYSVDEVQVYQNIN
ncbi:PD-(D/E)XK motif protein [Pontibacter akesuensis]|uniref:Putative PD-(D/E)XK family member n=1 Tax=Pontibacter akesuensis TaxID=388950 RepID=A0A1I7JCD8_9BACT|nr:PD-(D/E)XK motif protein [Pontibacter akesuensis]SFU82818.1 Putative PD-(D/E)XK family member [Pontibacter akesuensis]